VTSQDRQALSISVGATVGFALVGGALAGDAVTSWYPSLRKSRLVLPLWAFLPVAALYYLMCGVILFRLLARVAPSRERRTALTQLITMMAANEGWNYLMFGRRSPRAGLVGMIGFAGLTISLLRALRRADPRSATLLWPYLAWLGYDLIYAYELWRLNH
jgi:translocator protein